MADFYDRLYFGLGYEYHALGHFWRLGYEAFKIDADFGFDLLVYNQMKRIKEVEHVSHPYLIQVKAARASEWSPKDRNAGERQEATVRFYLNKQHYDNLIKEEYAYLLCYVVDSTDEKDVIAYFWLSHDQLKYLNNYQNDEDDHNSLTWFRQYSENQVILEACLHRQADLKKNFEKILKEEKEESSVVSKFKVLLEKCEHINNENSRDYFSLIAQKRNGKSKEFSLKTDFMKLSKFNDADTKKQTPFMPSKHIKNR